MNTELIDEYFSTSESKSVRVLLWLLKNRNEKNVVNATIDMIALDCNVTKMTVNRVFKKLYDTGFIEKLRNSEYLLKKV
ncbi:hypothetical protein vBAmePPT11V19_00090 [Alteromonas phage vB_AmeP_PT11-V19]|nr:hypothetical protein vBAmePPT11V19_00090 [Alteromonas phage vB_AmeP_PT11-V19]